jgi:uncharacterized protein YndB with AHSA1/START domain
MQRTSTHTITISSPPDRVFAFVADPHKLPVWAIGFCRDIVDDGDHWLVTTPSGERIPMRSVASSELRVLDSSWELGPQLEGRAYTRVVANGEGATYVFTMVQPEGMADAFFEAQGAELERELTVLKAHLETSCPISGRRADARSPRR